MEVDTLSIELEKNDPACCRTVGWPGVGLYVLALAIAGAQLYIAAEYTFYFQDVRREGVWEYIEYEKRLNTTVKTMAVNINKHSE